MASSSPLSLHWFLTTILLASFVSAQCYYVNGTALPANSEYEPCAPSSGGAPTTCCGTNRANPAGSNRTQGAFTRDECLPNGLCQNRYYASTGEYKVSYWIDFCTSPDVNSKACLNICNPRYPVGNSQITPCASGTDEAKSETWCCGANRNCCEGAGKEVVRLAQVLGGALSSSVGSATTTGLSTTTMGSSTTTPSASLNPSPARNTPTSTPPPRPSPRLSKPIIGGIVAGVLIGFLLLASVIFLTRRHDKKARSNPSEVPHSALVEAPSHAPPSQYVAHENPIEKDARPQVAELMVMPSELPAEELGMKR